jgi:hypothetical protein
MRHSFVIAVAATTVLTACGRKEAGTDSTATSAAASATTAAASPPASVMIMTPGKGATTGADVTVTLMAHGVTIAKADGAKVPGVGHYHLFLDTIPTPDNAPIPPTSAKIVHIGSGDSSYTFKALKPGEHRLIAVLGFGDHTPMPGGRDTVTFTVKP